MRKLRITIAQINTMVGDLDGNVERSLAAVREARSHESDLIVFPELTLSGYPPEDLLLKPGFLERCRIAFDRFVEDIDDDLCAVVGFVDGIGPVYNAAAVVTDRTVRCIYRKMLLPNYGVFDEKRYFTPGDQTVSFVLGDVHIGLSICEDIWEEEGPHCTLSSELAVDMVVNLSSSPFHAGKIKERADLLAARSRETNAAFLYVNLVGGQDELVFDGGSFLFDRKGICRAKLPMFKQQVAALDLEFDRAADDAPTAAVRLPAHGAYGAIAAPVMAPDLSTEAEILEALVLGTGDYIRKNGFEKVVIGLSGGIDSSLVAVVAVEALGPENVIGVTMPSVYTSTGTRSDAETLADNLGIKFHEIPISDIFDSYGDTLGDIFSGVQPDVTEENIQARIRGTLLMALSNKFGWLVLTTGNKSEMATGYATLYGDMAGGFAVIKDVPKLMVYRICAFINERRGHEVIPESVIARPPSAELRPDQKDADSLPPYDVLDPILKAYIEDDRGVNDIIALGFDPAVVKRVVRLCDQSEYKRRQAPPGVKITPRAFGRDRRLPITNRFRP